MTGGTMRQLAYFSDASAGMCPSDLKNILNVARLNNRQAFVTGLLLFDGAQFLQVLEGKSAEVAIIFERILADVRHENVRVQSDREVPGREFGNWAMAANEDEGNFGARVEGLLAMVTCPLLKATFGNFADYV